MKCAQYYDFINVCVWRTMCGGALCTAAIKFYGKTAALKVVKAKKGT